MKCTYLGCNKEGTKLDNVEVAPGIYQKKQICNKHKGQLVKNISKKGKRIKKQYIS